eukprot:1767203-Amphidinium_carterae.2
MLASYSRYHCHEHQKNPNQKNHNSFPQERSGKFLNSTGAREHSPPRQEARRNYVHCQGNNVLESSAMATLGDQRGRWNPPA